MIPSVPFMLLVLVVFFVAGSVIAIALVRGARMTDEDAT